MTDPEAMRILREWDMPASLRRYRRLMASLGMPARDIKDENCEAGMHKARIAIGAAGGFTDAEIAASRAWLAEHGFRETIGLRL